jgi:prepilin peptidase CpaA
MPVLPPDDLVVVAVTAIAAATDVRSGRIPNTVTYPAIACGLALAAAGHSGTVGESLAGAILGGLPLYLFFAAGWMGGGDVKLIAAVGAVKGPTFVVAALFYSTVIAGVCAATALIWRGHARAVAGDIRAVVAWGAGRAPAPTITPRAGSFPFGAAIALGTLMALFASGLR